MRNALVTRAFENLFHLNAEPIFVVSEGQQEENLTDTRHEERRKNTCVSMFSALCAVQPQGIIKVGNGLFTENLEVRLPGVRIQGEQGVAAILASQKYPTLIIDLPNKEDKLFLEGMRFAHLCDHDKEILRWAPLKELRNNRYRGLKTAENMNTSILLRKGTLQIDQCRLSFAGQRDPSRLCPVIVVEEEGSLVLARSQIVGGVGSVGVYCNGGKVNIRECSFRDHGGVSVLVTGGPQTSLVLKNSTIAGGGDGLVLNGPFTSSVENNNILDCTGAGVALLFGNNCNLINNQINKCRIGLQIENSVARVMKNTLRHNKEFGCSIHSRMNAECKPHLRFNLLSQNGRGGIHIAGGRNRAEIYNNVVSYNQRVGIRVENNAHPHIFLNEVSRNFGCGVHLARGGTAFLQKNEISGSTNCNLVLQGPNNIDNYVYNNRICEARGQGVLLLYCEKFLIAKNDISRNYNGVLAVTSVVNLEDNKISDNKCNGLMMLDDCQLLVTQNVFSGNRRTALIARNTSSARIKQNRFQNNRIDLLAEQSWDTLVDVQGENQFGEKSDIRIPGNLCSLI